MMNPIKKQIVTNEAMQPVAVIIDYADWQQIVSLLKLEQDGDATTDLSIFAGSISLNEDPLAYQQRMREEWS